jgi:peptide/nickel transport system permease protein
VLAYIAKRLAMSAVVAVLVMVFLSAFVHLVPGDPVRIILGPKASEALSELVREEMGLDDPVPVQVWDFVSGAFRGDLGQDFVSGLPVTELISEALPHTLVLAATALGLAALFGVPLGVLAATRPDSILDRVIAVLSISMITLASYVAGLFLLLLFAVRLGWLPAIGVGSFSDPGDYLKHLVLPATALAVTWVGYLGRLVRASMLEVLGANYIRTAHSFGVPARIVFYKYALKNAIIPTIAVLGVAFGSLMSNAIFVEVIFARPGLGSLIFDSIGDRNFPVVQGGILVVALITVGANLAADLSYRFLDPRIRVGGGRA